MACHVHVGLVHSPDALGPILLSKCERTTLSLDHYHLATTVCMGNDMSTAAFPYYDHIYLTTTGHIQIKQSLLCV